MEVFISTAAQVYLESVVEDGNAGMEEAGICSERTKTVSGGDRPGCWDVP